jgi:hypothetical protein
MRRLGTALRVATVGMLAWAVITELAKPKAERRWYGSLAGVVPYDLRLPTFARVRQRWWNPADERLLTPHVFGVGWSVNLARARDLLHGEGEPAARSPAAPAEVSPAPDPEPPRPD